VVFLNEKLNWGEHFTGKGNRPMKRAGKNAGVADE